jgi:hypothetical protein
MTDNEPSPDAPKTDSDAAKRLKHLNEIEDPKPAKSMTANDLPMREGPPNTDIEEDMRATVRNANEDPR